MSGERILLRAASGPEIGVGHLMRTRAVAQALVARGARPCFGLDDAELGAHLRAQGFEVVAPGAVVPGSHSAAWFDGFCDWSAELAAHASAGARTVLVENRGPSRGRADFIVYPALHYAPDAWDLSHPERVRAGAAWTPLAREVLEQQPAAERDTDLVVTFGGADPRRLTERFLAALAAIDFDGVVRVAVGPHMQDRRPQLARAAARLALGELLERPEDLAPALTRARAAATALGTTLYELAWLGVPALVLANYPEDLAALEHYAEHGPHLPLGVAEELDERKLARLVAEGLAALAVQDALLAPDARRVLELGGGADRLAGLLLGDSSQSEAAGG